MEWPIRVVCVRVIFICSCINPFLSLDLSLFLIISHCGVCVCSNHSAIIAIKWHKEGGKAIRLWTGPQHPAHTHTRVDCLFSISKHGSCMQITTNCKNYVDTD